ncbi:MAG TPA: dihydrofolate reductase family protein [Gemmatimonadaceae bacterium]|nr:dihydrofolate reductase family protein [Gemmatimonadaceae bacterium]
MRNVIMWNIISLDGYFEGTKPWDLPFHLVVWGEELERRSIEQLDGADALLFGRATYEGMAAHWPTATGAVAERMNRIEKVVFSNTLDAATWNNSRLVRGEAADEVERLKRSPGKDLLIFGSAILSGALTRRGLIDEYRIGVAPVILGAGRPLFAPSEREHRLALMDTSMTKTGCAVLTYRKAG